MLADEIDRLSRLCGMLGSSNDGERAIAALKATEFLKARNLTWDDFIRQRVTEQPKPKRERQPRPPHWSEGPRTDPEWIKAIWDHCRPHLTDWELDFIASVVERNKWPLSPKQRDVVLRMKNKYCEAYE